MQAFLHIQRKTGDSGRGTTRSRIPFSPVCSARPTPLARYVALPGQYVADKRRARPHRLICTGPVQAIASALAEKSIPTIRAPRSTKLQARSQFRIISLLYCWGRHIPSGYCCSSRARGNVRKKVEPFPSSDSNQSCPLCRVASTRHRPAKNFLKRGRDAWPREAPVPRDPIHPVAREYAETDSWLFPF